MTLPSALEAQLVGLRHFVREGIGPRKRGHGINPEIAACMAFRNPLGSRDSSAQTNWDERILPAVRWQEILPGSGGNEETEAIVGLILLIVLVVLLLGTFPTWPHSRGWGYRPSGVVGVILLIVLILFLMGRL